MAQIRSFLIWEIRVIRGQKHGDEKVEERAQLAGRLLLSLDEPSESEVERFRLYFL
jgi:hypothetical protein